MSSTIYFLKRDKALGGVTNRDDKYQMLGELDSSIAIHYFISAGIRTEQVGDVVHNIENEDGLWLDSEETFNKFWAHKMERLRKFVGFDKLTEDNISKALELAAFDRDCLGSYGNPLTDDITYLMTEDRKNRLLNHYEVWKQMIPEMVETSEDIKDAIEFMDYYLKQLVGFIEAVDFDKENMYFAYSY